MATILLTGEDASALSSIAATIESMGHATLQAHTTENIVEDVVLNDVSLVIAMESSIPFSGYEVADILREDPTVPPALPIVLASNNAVSPRKLEAHRLTAVLSPEEPAHAILETLVTLLGDEAAPEPSGRD